MGSLMLTSVKVKAHVLDSGGFLAAFPLPCEGLPSPGFPCGPLPCGVANADMMVHVKHRQQQQNRPSSLSLSLSLCQHSFLGHHSS